MGSRRPARHADVAVVARGGTIRHGDAGRTIRRVRRQRAPDRQDRIHRRHVPLRHPATVGEQSPRHHLRGTPRGRSPQRVDDDGRRPEADVDRHAGAVAAAHRTAGLGRPGHAVRRQVTRRVADGRAPRQPVERGRRHPAEREERRQPGDGAEVRRLQAARGVPRARRARTAASTCAAATSCRSTTPPDSNRRRITSAGSTASSRRARTWPGPPASGSRWTSRSSAGCSPSS